MPRCAAWRAPPLPPPPDPAAAGLPVTPRRRRSWALPLVLVVGTALTVALIYTGLHRVRLMVQAHAVGLAPKTFRASYVAQRTNEYDNPAPGTDIKTSGDSFPYDAPLPDGHRRIALVFPKRPYDSGSNSLGPTLRHGKLYLCSTDAIATPCVAAFPDGMDSLAGITNDHRILAAHLHLTPDGPNDYLGPGTITYDKPVVIDLTRVGVLDNPAPLEHFQAIAPRVGPVEEIAISPTGDRLLWSIYFLRTPNPVVAWAGRYVKFLDRYAERRSSIAVYVTGIHGENPTRIGEESAEKRNISPTTTVGANTNPRSEYTPLPAHLRWEPDGKAIRFTYDDNDYTVALDGR